MPRSANGDMLDRRALSRATLERQMLLRRWDGPVLDAVRRLGGLNAQDPSPPYLSLWTRLSTFDPAALTDRLYDRTVVRASLLRGTQHMVTADDYLTWRAPLQPVLDRCQRGFFGKATAGLDLDELATAARRILTERPFTRAQLGRELAESWPDRPPNALAWSAQFRLPLVHPPPNGTWGKAGQTTFVLAEKWLDRPVDDTAGPRDLVLRHLAAFGPATVKDIQAWCGLTRLGEVIERLDPPLRPYRDGNGQQLYDLPEAPRPDPDTPAPVRFLPAVDNLLLAHSDRSRVISDEHRKRVCVGAVVEPTVLVDGEVVAIWKITREGVLAIEPLARLPRAARADVVAEGTRLLEFAAADADNREVRIAAAG
jgi:hypothetical protein